MPDAPQPFLISALPPSREQKRAAFVVSLLLFVMFLLALAFARIELAKVDVFIPLIATVMFLTDSITATLLFAQFSILRSRALLVLASGYLFTALTIVPYALTFPGAFAPTGLLGAGRQAPPWFNTIWHIGLPAAIIAYALLSNPSRGKQFVRTSARFAILASAGGVIVLVCVLTLFITQHDELLPVLLVTDVLAADRIVKVIASLFIFLSITAIVFLWMRPHSILDLGLLVVSLAWMFGSLLFMYLQTRYTVGWYMIRIFEVAAASFVLLLLLAESTILYARLSLSVLAQRREREGRVMSMDAMSAAIAHEVAQPLSSIVTFANAGVRWLKRSSPDVHEACDAFERIAADGHRASDVIQSVRTMFSGSEQARSPLDTNELVRETIALVHADLVAAGIAVQLELAEQLPLVSASRGQLQQVILNLIANAGDAMRAIVGRARVLRVQSEPSGANGVALSVEDAGTGIDPKNIDRIFDAFFTTKTNGMGVGLAICSQS